MKIYDCYVPREDYVKAKDYTILIYNKERKRFPRMADGQYEKHLAKLIREEYRRHEGVKPLVQILKEYYEKVKKEG